MIVDASRLWEMIWICHYYFAFLWLRLYIRYRRTALGHNKSATLFGGGCVRVLFCLFSLYFAHFCWGDVLHDLVHLCDAPSMWYMLWWKRICLSRLREEKKKWSFLLTKDDINRGIKRKIRHRRKPREFIQNKITCVYLYS